MQGKPSKACCRPTRWLDTADAVHSCFFSEGVFRGAHNILYFFPSYNLPNSSESPSELLFIWRIFSMKNTKWSDLIISVVSSELIGALSAIISGDFSSFYNDILRPPLSPPSFVFPVVWAILYALMGFSAYLVWNERFCPTSKSAAKKLYIFQLAVNFVWSIIFFRFRLLGIAAIIAIILLIIVVCMIFAFKKINPFAALLNIPYSIWLTFASYLALGVFFLNS